MNCKKLMGVAFSLTAGIALLLGSGSLTIAQSNDNSDWNSNTTIRIQGQPMRHFHRMGAPMYNRAIRVMVNGQPVDFQGPGPMMTNGVVFVPIRDVFEQMGGYVEWHEDSQSVTGFRQGRQFRIVVGNDTALVDGVSRDLPSPAKVIDGTTFVPLRFASEALGARVFWHSDTNTVVIKSDQDHDAGPNNSDSGNQ